MSKGFSNLIRLTHGAQRQTVIMPGERCLLCNEPATHKVLSVNGWGPACAVHAEQGRRLGYEVMGEEGSIDE